MPVTSGATKIKEGGEVMKSRSENEQRDWEDTIAFKTIGLIVGAVIGLFGSMLLSNILSDFLHMRIFLVGILSGSIAGLLGSIMVGKYSVKSDNPMITGSPLVVVGILAAIVTCISLCVLSAYFLETYGL